VYEAGEEQRSLWNVRGQLILADKHGLRLGAADADEALFTTGPPVDQQAWLRLSDLLQQLAAPIAGDDLEAMLGQFGGSPVVLPGARLADLHLTAEGFRFVGELPETALGQAAWTAGLVPGAYAIEYEPAVGYRAVPLGPASLTVAVRPDQPVSVVGEPLTIAVDLANSGGVDARELRVELMVARGEQAKSLASATVDALAGVPATAVLAPWSSPSAGLWTFSARVRLPDGTLVAEGSASVTIQEPVLRTRAAELTREAQFSNGALYALLVGLGIMAGLLALMVFRGRRT
jgi:hypothetical protein